MIDGVTVATARKTRGWSRRELAERSGVPESSLYTMERKGRTPNPNEKVKLAAAFGWDYEGRPLPQPMPEWTDAPVVDEPEPPVELEPIHRVISAPLREFDPIDGERREPAPGEHLCYPGCGHYDMEMAPLTQVMPPPEGPVAEEGVRLISHSELRTFKACRRRWWLEWHRGLRPKVESPIGVQAVGNRIHQALALYYTPGGVSSIDPATALEMLILRDWTALTESLGGPQDFLQKEFDKEANLERAMVTGYVEWLANTGADADLEVIAPETYVEYSIGPTGDYREVRLIGRLDVRVRRITDGSVMFIDHKTVANFATPARTFQLDEQMLHYHLLERRRSDLAVPRSDGALYNMLRRVKRSVQAKPPFYERVQIRHNDHEIDSYEIRTTATVQDIIRVEEAIDRSTDPRMSLAAAYPRPSRECSWCPFFEVCPMFDDGSRAEDMISARYRVGDPLDYYRTPAMAGAPDQGTEETE